MDLNPKAWAPRRSDGWTSRFSRRNHVRSQLPNAAHPLTDFRSPSGTDPTALPNAEAFSSPPGVWSPPTHQFPRSPVDTGIPHPPPSGFRVFHPLAGLLLLGPCGLVSSHKRPWGSALQGVPLSPRRPARHRPYPLLPLPVGAEASSGRLQGFPPGRESVRTFGRFRPEGGRYPPELSTSSGYDLPCNGHGFPSPPLLCFRPFHIRPLRVRSSALERERLPSIDVQRVSAEPRRPAAQRPRIGSSLRCRTRCRRAPKVLPRTASTTKAAVHRRPERVRRGTFGAHQPRLAYGSDPGRCLRKRVPLRRRCRPGPTVAPRGHRAFGGAARSRAHRPKPACGSARRRASVATESGGRWALLHRVQRDPRVTSESGAAAPNAPTVTASTVRQLLESPVRRPGRRGVGRDNLRAHRCEGLTRDHLRRRSGLPAARAASDPLSTAPVAGVGSAPRRELHDGRSVGSPKAATSRGPPSRTTGSRR